jgi:hypothetical protein
LKKNAVAEARVIVIFVSFNCPSGNKPLCAYTPSPFQQNGRAESWMITA